MRKGGRRDESAGERVPRGPPASGGRRQRRRGPPSRRPPTLLHPCPQPPASTASTAGHGCQNGTSRRLERRTWKSLTKSAIFSSGGRMVVRRWKVPSSCRGEAEGGVHVRAAVGARPGGESAPLVAVLRSSRHRCPSLGPAALRHADQRRSHTWLKSSGPAAEQPHPRQPAGRKQAKARAAHLAEAGAGHGDDAGVLQQLQAVEGVGRLARRLGRRHRLGRQVQAREGVPAGGWGWGEGARG